MVFTIDDAKRVQRDLGLGDRHVVYYAGVLNFTLSTGRKAHLTSKVDT